MIETEAKIQLSKEEFRELYQRLGHPEFVLQKNWGYVSENSVIRVREEGEKKYVTLKRSNQAPGKYNSREEIELMISDVGSVKRIFEILGLTNKYYYEKKRATTNVGNCVVCLDSIARLGEFVEVEGEANNIEGVLEGFGLLNKPIERRSYFEMLRMNT